MKFNIYISLMLLIVAAISACTPRKVTELQELVMNINLMCPLNEGAAGDMLSVEYDKQTNEVKMDIAADTRFTDIGKLREHRELQLDCLRLSFHKADATRLLKAMTAADASLNVIYTNQSNGQTVNFRITADELKDEVKKQITTHQKDSVETAARVALENAMCPREIGRGLFLDGVDITGGNILYIYRINNDFKSDRNLENEKDSIENAIYANLRSLLNHHRKGRELRQVADLGYGLVYIYNIESGNDRIDIVVTGDTLKQLVEQCRPQHFYERR